VIPPKSKELEREDKRSYWQRFVEFIHPGPDSREELLDALSDAEDNQVIGAESRQMLEGVLRMADLQRGP
jgi:magnesium and cobalt transporter